MLSNPSRTQEARELNDRVRDSIKALMTSRRLSRQELALKLSQLREKDKGIDIATVNRWLSEKEPTLPQLQNLLILAEVFDVSLDELVGSDAKIRTVPAPIRYRDRELIEVVRHPRRSEKDGVAIARKLCAGKSPEEVMDELNFDARRFQHCLKRAVYGDLLQVRTENVPLHSGIVEYLRHEFELGVCEVAKIGDLNYGVLQTVILGALGAEVVKEEAKRAKQIVGLAGGFSCARVIVSLIQTIQSHHDIQVVPIAVRASLSRGVALDANTLVGMFGYLSGRTEPKHVKGLPNISNANLEPDSTTVKFLDKIVEKTSVVFLGLGGDVRIFFDRAFDEQDGLSNSEGGMSGLTQAMLHRQRCIGDILYNFVRLDGVIEDLREVCDRLVCSIKLDGLARLVRRRIPVIALVADTYKIPVVRLALREKYINGLITTDEVAEGLLK